MGNDHIAVTEPVRRLEVFTGAGWRRTWRHEDKARIALRSRRAEARSVPFDTDEDAISIANDTIYGLAAGMWTRSMRRALLASKKLEVGTVWVNTYRAVGYMSPFGGYKHSGIGRESGIEAINEYLQTKSVWIDINESVPDPFLIH